MNRELNETFQRAHQKAAASGEIVHLGRTVWHQQILPVLLNGLPAKSRVFELIEYCQLAQAESIKIGPTPRRERLLDWRHREETLRALLDRINLILSKYRFHPSVQHFPGLALLWQPDGIYDPNADPISESSGIQAVLELLQAGKLDRLRRCAAPNCSRWFFAGSFKKLVCSDGCRFKKYQAKHESKEKRKEYMRRYMSNPRVKARRKKRAAMQDKRTNLGI